MITWDWAKNRCHRRTDVVVVAAAAAAGGGACAAVAVDLCCCCCRSSDDHRIKNGWGTEAVAAVMTSARTNEAGILKWGAWWPTPEVTEGNCSPPMRRCHCNGIISLKSVNHAKSQLLLGVVCNAAHLLLYVPLHLFWRK